MNRTVLYLQLPKLIFKLLLVKVQHPYSARANTEANGTEQKVHKKTHIYI